MPALTAWTAAWMRFSRCSLLRMLAMWLETVLVLSPSSRPIVWLLSPLARREEDLEFAFGQDGPDRPRGRSGAGGYAGDVAIADALQQLPGDLRGEDGFSGGCGSDRCNDLVGECALEDVAGGAGDGRLYQRGSGGRG